jgi:hypothetical protein
MRAIPGSVIKWSYLMRAPWVVGMVQGQTPLCLCSTEGALGTFL